MALDNPSPYTAQILAELETQNLVNYHTAVPSALLRSYLETMYGITTLDGLKNQTGGIVLVDKGNIIDVTGISYARNVSQLWLVRADLETIDDVSNMTSLSILRIFGNTLTSIGYVDNLSGLTVLSVGDNQLTNIGSVGNLVNLVEFFVYNNQFSQSVLEAQIDELHTNRLALGAISCVISMAGNPGSTATAASKASEISDLIAAGCTVTI